MRENGVNRKYKILLAFTSVLAICLMILLGLSMSGALPALSGTDKSGTAAAEDIPESLSHEGYTLEKVVVLSRHNIRSPLSGGDSILGTITPHEWFEMTRGSSRFSADMTPTWQACWPLWGRKTTICPSR